MSIIHFKILEIDKQLDECDRMIEQLPELISRAMKERQKHEEVMDSQNEQLEAFILAENEVVNQIEALFERK